VPASVYEAGISLAGCRRVRDTSLMTEFLKMDIFFFVATFSLLIITTLIAFAIYKLLRILKHVERIAEIAGNEAQHLREDAAYIRGRLLGALDGMFAFIPRSRRKKKESEEKTEE
jgi:hypothetical protein